MWKKVRKILYGEDDDMSVEERRDDRRSRVRVAVTYWAAAYIFGGSAILIVLALFGSLTDAKFSIIREVFTMVLPIATGVVTYWFATRQSAATRQMQSNGVEEQQLAPQAPTSK